MPAVCKTYLLFSNVLFIEPDVEALRGRLDVLFSQLFIALYFVPVFLCDDQHSKALAILFLQIFVMHLMCPAYGFYIPVGTAGKQFETLMYDDVMHNKIGSTIHGNTGADTHQPPDMVEASKHNGQPAWYGEDDKEHIVLFKEAGAFFMMIFMQVPEKAVHDILMRKPCNSLHDNKGADSYQRINYPGHKKVLSTIKNNTWIINKSTAKRLCLLNRNALC